MSEISATALSFSQFHMHTTQRHSRTVAPETSVLEAWLRMQQLQVSELLVAKEYGGEFFLLGQISEPGLSALVLEQRSLVAQLKVFEVMQPKPVTCSVGAGVFEMIQTMQESKLSLLPLVNDEGSLQGVVTAEILSQLLKAALQDLESLSSSQTFQI